MLGNKPPYTTMQQLNLDWILSKLKTLLRLVPDDGAVGQILRRTRDGAVWSDEQGGGGGAVQSVNGKTGAVVLDAADVGALPDDYTPPVTSVNGQTGAVTVSVPVQSVNGKTGAVVLDADDVGALPDDYTPPVTSVNGQTGAVTVSVPVQSVNGKTGAVVLDAADVAALPDDYTPPVTSVNGQTGAVMLGAPTTISLSIGTVYMKGLRAPGTGLSIEITLLKQPKAVTGSNIAYYYNDTWNSVSVGSWFFSGSTLIIVFTNPPSASGLYGMRGTINITY